MTIKTWTKRSTVVGIAIGATATVGIAAAATNWVVGVAASSAAGAQSASISNLSITATTPISATNLLYPGNPGDVLLTITNSNKFPVTITALGIPSTAAAGYTDASLTTANAISTCAVGSSLVTWVGGGSSRTLGTPLIVDKNASLVVT